MKRSITLATLALSSVLAVAGCGIGDSGSYTTGAAPETTASSSTTDAASAAPSGPTSGEPIATEHNDADVTFAQMMIPHHQQAIAMSETLLGKEDVPQDVRDFAQKVTDAQEPEIQRMEIMLQAWGEPATNQPGNVDHGSAGHGSDSSSQMNGMMSAEDMTALEDAQGAEAARLYLEQMTEHHRGAIDMAREEVSSGQNPQAVELAQQIAEDQEAEITEIETMLQDLPDQS